MDLRDYPDFEPRAVVETVRKGTEFIYNAEVAFDHDQRVVGTKYPTREAAKAAAQVYVDQMVAEFRATAKKILGHFPQVKE